MMVASFSAALATREEASLEKAQGYRVIARLRTLLIGG
jgi:hypothetical protein